MLNIDSVLNGKRIDDFLATADRLEIKKLFQLAQSQKIAVLRNIKEAETRPDYKYSADENDAYIFRLNKLAKFLSAVVTSTSIALSEINHKEKIQNKRDKVMAEQFKAFRQIMQKHCSVEIRDAIFKEYNAVKIEIENRYFPDKKVRNETNSTIAK